ncbi:hypothetical protein [Pedobacter sp. Leaf176]|uniref:hypothetical protein n=1 Tax=Pedobacter sp. Leaf176 TaxID=1736286 RepID=UPI000A92B10B|nr:hypothetical protein [Pedobacter sp. Leaf176]
MFIKLKDTDYDEYCYFTDVSVERSAERRASSVAVVRLPDKVKNQPNLLLMNRPKE